MIAVLIKSIVDIDTLRPTLSELAKKYVKYGVEQYRYAAARTLINTFEEILAAGITPDIRQAWLAVYGENADAMIGEAYYKHNSSH